MGIVDTTRNIIEDGIASIKRKRRDKKALDKLLKKYEAEAQKLEQTQKMNEYKSKINILQEKIQAKANSVKETEEYNRLMEETTDNADERLTILYEFSVKIRQHYDETLVCNILDSDEKLVGEFKCFFNQLKDIISTYENTYQNGHERTSNPKVEQLLKEIDLKQYGEQAITYLTFSELSEIKRLEEEYFPKPKESEKRDGSDFVIDVILFLIRTLVESSMNRPIK